MHYEERDRFTEVTKFATDLVQSYAQQIDVALTSIDLEDGRLSRCHDIHLLTISSEDTSVSVSLSQNQLDACLDSGAGEELKLRIARAVCRMGRQL